MRYASFMRRNAVRILVAVSLGACFVACGKRMQQTGAATLPSPRAGGTARSADAKPKDKEAAGGKFTHAPSGIELGWPAGWEQKQKDDYEWAIFPARADGGAECWISLDVPTLPWHPPGMIP